ncbi:AI-2E family transporter [Aldersonia kunmingensis]|uniref:AI-2E family transporter n=1 Tax=Aldersonia kunmingensis TaxID=408066 RepID=UPI00082F6B19|nr:AI-2E family transporter [Aldersonia kunmingensis]
MSVDATGSGAERRSPADSVHPLVRVGAEWAWRLLVIFALVICLALALERLSTVIIPVAIALMISALLVPSVDWMNRRRVPRSIAVLIAIVVTMGIVAGVLTFVVDQFIRGLPELSEKFTDSISEIQDWLTGPPLNLSEDQIHRAGDSIVKAINSNQEELTSGALTTATVIGEVATGALLTLFTLIFFLYGGAQIWEFVTRIVPMQTRAKVRTAGVLGFGTLVGFVRATVAVAAVDAICIGAGLAILGVPLALPLASLIFIGAFIPIIGAFLTGFIAVFIALVTKGFVTALIVLGIIVGVMQLEGHVLQPLMLGRAVRIHPLAVVLSITVGLVLAGIPGALVAVPLVAMLNTAIRSLMARDPDEELEAESAAEGSSAVKPGEPEDRGRASPPAAPLS